MTQPAPAAPVPATAPPAFPAVEDADELPYGIDVGEAIAQALHAPPSPISFLESGPGGLYTPQHSFPHALSELREKLDAVLLHKDDPEELEHQAILFWPYLSRLHPWLGKGRRESELITYFDIVRAQFLLRPAALEVLMALRTVLHNAATASALTEDLVDEWIDHLEEAGSDMRFPLSFARPDED